MGYHDLIYLVFKSTQVAMLFEFKGLVVPEWDG